MAELPEELLDEIRLHAASDQVYTRVHTALLNMGVHTKKDILRIGRGAFQRQPNLGEKSIIVIGKIVGEHWSPRPLRNTTTDTLIAELQQRGYEVRKLKEEDE